MDKLDLYRKHIQELLQEMAGFRGLPAEVKKELVIDAVNDHYLLINVGWRENTRYYGNVVHLDILDDKVWLQEDNTDFRVAEKLIEKGIAKEDIVLGFQAPYKRPYTGFAVA